MVSTVNKRIHESIGMYKTQKKIWKCMNKFEYLAYIFLVKLTYIDFFGSGMPPSGKEPSIFTI